MNVPLMVACAIAGLHQGTVNTGSPGPGHGSTITVCLPLMQQGAAVGQPVPESGEKRRLRVLAIEDNRDFAQLFRHMLEIMGCELDITSDARSGLKSAHDIQPQLIFCDIGLPGDMDGFAFARSLRADPLLAHIPLVAVSAITARPTYSARSTPALTASAASPSSSPISAKRWRPSRWRAQARARRLHAKFRLPKQRRLQG